jgi:hypothetical protein
VKLEVFAPTERDSELGHHLVEAISATKDDSQSSGVSSTVACQWGFHHEVLSAVIPNWGF